MFHVNSKGVVGKCNAKKKCPFGDLVNDHYATVEEAAYSYELKNKARSFSTFKKSMEDYRGALMKYTDRYPVEIIEGLSDFLDAQPTEPLIIMPHGSDLYNTKIPGRNTHDYDFVVFTTPGNDKRATIAQHLDGELDVTTIEITKLNLYSERSAPVTESFFGSQVGHGLYTNTNNEWGEYMRNYRMPLQKYYALLGRVFESHRFDEPALMSGDKVNFKNFKNCVRWGIYMKRWGVEAPVDSFDPRLSEGEREFFLRAINSGYFNDIYE